MAQRAKAQKEAASGLQNPLEFLHRAVEDAGKTYKAAHYDHGNSVSTADVDGDDRIDLYFINQVGCSELWRNLGGGKFEEITDRAGVAIGDRVAVGASFADIDNDGDADLYVTALRTGNLLFENDGTGRFNEVTRKSGLGYKGHSSAALFFDFDRDGLLDLFLANVGAYTSADVRKAESDGRPYEFYDGLKDAFGGHLKPERTERSLLFHNDGAGKFTDVTDAVGLDEPSWTGDATPMDPNEDGWPDLYVLNMQGHDQYWENQEGKRFVKRSRELFPKTPWGSMGAMRFDYNNDGRFDLYITEMHSDMSQEVGIDDEKKKSIMAWPASFTRTGDNSIFGNALFVGTGTDLFSEESDALGAETYWPWGCSVGDLNADGFDDIFVTGGMSYPFRYGINSVLMNDQGRKFVDSEFVLNVEPRRRARTEQPWFTLDCIGADKSHKLCAGRSGELEALGTLSTRTSVLLDIEGDGDLDIVTGDFHSPPMVLISNLAQRHEIRYLEIALEGVKSNRNGLGAVVRVRMQDGTKMMKVNDGKSGYLSQSLLPLYFGLGNREVASIEVSWPSGVVQQVATPIQANSRLRIREDG